VRIYLLRHQGGDMQVIKFDDFKNQGEALFGRDPKDWLFECPNCKAAQSFHDFTDLGITTENTCYLLGVECIGRYDKSKGCTWMLGDAIKIHEVEIINPNGRHQPHFKLVSLS
jgi:hypothetical protein